MQDNSFRHLGSGHLVSSRCSVPNPMACRFVPTELATAIPIPVEAYLIFTQVLGLLKLYF